MKFKLCNSLLHIDWFPGQARSNEGCQMTARQDGLRKTALGTIGSGNVFADLGFPDPETELAKSNLVIKIDETIEKRGLTYARASKIMEMPRQELTKLLRGHTRPYTVERLKELLSRLSA